MGKKEKLIKRLKLVPTNFTYSEARTLLGMLGYLEENKGRTSGSRVMFKNPADGSRIYMHKPHPDSTLKHYQVKELEEILEREGRI